LNISGIQEANNIFGRLVVKQVIYFRDTSSVKYIVPFSSESFVFCLLSINSKIKAWRTIIFPVVLYRHETWSLTLREEYGLMVFENRVPEDNISA
jgi:hypothetical protein